MTYELKKEKDFIEILFEHENSEIDTECENQYVALAKEIKMDGFRPGKVPPGLIKKIIKKEEVKKQVFQGFLKKEIEKIKIDEEIFEEPEINFLEENKKTFKSKAKLYLYPTIKLNEDYENKIKDLEFEESNDNLEITEERIENYIKETIASHGEEEFEINEDSMVNIFNFEMEEIKDKTNLKEMLHEKVKMAIIEDEKYRVENDNYEKIIDTMIKISDVNISDKIIQKHKQEIFENFLTRSGMDENMSIEKFQEITGKNIETELLEATKNKIAYYLLITEINKKEKIFHSIMNEIENKIESLSEESLRELFLNYQENIQEMDKNNFYVSEANIEKFKNFIMKKAKI
jgi:FKBP-type peptidyl-prolyl cis-trans isomerase (trigger factor)